VEGSVLGEATRGRGARPSILLRFRGGPVGCWCAGLLMGTRHLDEKH